MVSQDQTSVVCKNGRLTSRYHHSLYHSCSYFVSLLHLPNLLWALNYICAVFFACSLGDQDSISSEKNVREVNTLTNFQICNEKSCLWPPWEANYQIKYIFFKKKIKCRDISYLFFFFFAFLKALDVLVLNLQHPMKGLIVSTYMVGRYVIISLN